MRLSVGPGSSGDRHRVLREREPRRAERAHREYIEGITFVGWLLFTSIVGEGAALAALASGNPHLVYLVLVVIAIGFQLTCLGGVVLQQAVRRVEHHDAEKARRGYTLVGVGIVVFVLMVFSAAVWPR